MKASMTALGILAALLMAAPAISQEFNGEIVAPPQECNNALIEMVCDLEGNCEPEEVCYDSYFAAFAYPDEAVASEAGGSSTLTIDCTHIDGSTLHGSIVYVGSWYEWTGHYWAPTGRFGYCVDGYAVGPCDTVASPLPVLLGNYNDIAGTTLTVQACDEDYGIGDWNALSEFQTTRLNIFGCGGVDTLRGSPNPDRIIAGSGSDTAYGYGMDDFICGDHSPWPTLCYDSGTSGCRVADVGVHGQDILFGGEGADTINGNEAFDMMAGEGGDDFIGGEDGGDLIAGGEGNDQIQGNAGEDVLYGGRGCDLVYGGSENDNIYLYMTDAKTPDLCNTPPYYNEAHGGTGEDEIYGAKDANNRIWGDEEDDTLVGNNLSDWICGGNGIHDDLKGGDGNDIIADCLGGTEVLNDLGPGCDVEIFGQAGNDDVMCYFRKGTIVAGAEFCLNGGAGSHDDFWCDGEDLNKCKPVECEHPESTVDACKHNGDFTCTCY